MWPAALTRLLKRRLGYIILFLLTLLYIITKVVHRRPYQHLLESDEFSVERTKPLKWRTIEDHLQEIDATNRTNPDGVTCRNSIQGKELLVDDRGYICQSEHILPNGCCNVEISSTEYYSCQGCDDTQYCCGMYEYCVSCCLHPEKRTVLELALKAIKGRQAMVYAQVIDQFELCLVKCRTNSHSVKHENRYKNTNFRFCYGPTHAHESQLEVSGLGS